MQPESLGIPRSRNLAVTAGAILSRVHCPCAAQHNPCRLLSAGAFLNLTILVPCGI